MENIPKLIGVVGKINSGKDATGDAIRYLTEEFDHGLDDYMTGKVYKSSPYKIKKFADPLKTICGELLGVNKSHFEDREYKNTPLGQEWTKWVYRDVESGYSREFSTEAECDLFISYEVNGKMPIKYEKEEIQMTPRLFLQLMGTEAARGIIHDNIWINAAFANWHADDGDPSGQKWIFTDVRFPNEVKGIEERGGIIINVQREYVGPCITASDVCDKLVHLYASAGITSGEYIHNVSFNTRTPPQKIQEGIDMFLDWEDSPEHFIYQVPHISETALDHIDFKNVITNGYEYRKLVNDVKAILNNPK